MPSDREAAGIAGTVDEGDDMEASQDCTKSPGTWSKAARDRCTSSVGSESCFKYKFKFKILKVTGWSCRLTKELWALAQPGWNLEACQSDLVGSKANLTTEQGQTDLDLGGNCPTRVCNDLGPTGVMIWARLVKSAG